jgi:hypothetical protein
MGAYNDRGRAVKSEEIDNTFDNDTTFEYDAVYVGNGGTITLQLAQDTDWRTFYNVQSGSEHNWCLKRIRDDSTVQDLIGYKIQ